MKRLIVILAACLVTGAVFGAGSEPVFQLRAVLAAPAPDTELMTITNRLANNNLSLDRLNVQRTVLLNQTALRSAKATKDARSSPVIEISFSDTGREQFARLTGQYLHQRLAIVIDGRVYCAPIVQSPITNGTAQISGSFTMKEARKLAAEIESACPK